MSATTKPISPIPHVGHPLHPTGNVDGHRREYVCGTCMVRFWLYVYEEPTR